jgi:2-amino-4-hydroxy-6-hydroxymethyldihydropteridine diphosphokinase
MIYYINIGSNLGNPIINIQKAIGCISLSFRIMDKSDIFLSKAQFIDTKLYDFANIAIKITSTLSPLPLLAKLQEIENLFNITKEKHWKNRILDLDIVQCEKISVRTKTLCIPHKQNLDRDFVLLPLSQLEKKFQVKIVVKYIYGVMKLK